MQTVSARSRRDLIPWTPNSSRIDQNNSKPQPNRFKYEVSMLTPHCSRNDPLASHHISLPEWDAPSQLADRQSRLPPGRVLRLALALASLRLPCRVHKFSAPDESSRPYSHAAGFDETQCRATCWTTNLAYTRCELRGTHPYLAITTAIERASAAT
jgi:hypothetical protein